MQIKTQDIADTYGLAIVGLLTQEFPGSNSENTDAKVDAIEDVLIGTNQIRRGPVPSPERLVAIRSVIRMAIEEDVAIPLTMPWGAKKSRSEEPLDVAELFGMKQIQCLQSHIKRYHDPGIMMHIRLEDLHGMYIFRDEPNIEKRIYAYRDVMTRLPYVLDASGYIKVVPETALISKREEFYTRSTEMAELLQKATWGSMQASTAAGNALASLGVPYAISNVQRDFYMRRFQEFYPNLPSEGLRAKVAEYIAASIVRSAMGGVAIPYTLDGKHIKITFSSQIPGVPEKHILNELYYRALPLRMMKSHTPPWRGKGYFEFTDHRIVPRITTWDAPNDYNECWIELVGRDGTCIKLRADYAVKT